ncbi:hypothetical protein CTA1_8130 [Colletotrichum tanaceti]|uniref:Uncharacterized protein n=1 Tax=Colletotrichum tanaceti TaxID=1306861 RepID=A0A4U6XID9_9PEZI|nr:hypothetical protein CTA1_8130 [Colletotrichum tanaceti]
MKKPRGEEKRKKRGKWEKQEKQEEEEENEGSENIVWFNFTSYRLEPPCTGSECPEQGAKYRRPSNSQVIERCRSLIPAGLILAIPPSTRAVRFST